MKKIFKVIVLIAVFVLSGYLAQAQPGPPDPGPGGGDPIGGGAPIDGGLSILLLAAFSLGAHRLNQMRRKEELEQEVKN